MNPNLTNCVDARGGIFHPNESTSWSTQSLETGVDGAIYELNTIEETKLGRMGNGSYGFDSVTLGLLGSGLPTVQHQVIAGIWTNDFFIGSLGLSPMPFNFSNLNNPQQSLLTTLRNQSLIPSSSWAYTAGAHYKNPPVFGSLTLGGYDTTRFRSNNLSFSFGADTSRDLLVNLQSITTDTVGTTPLMASAIDVFIDSTVAEMWLPIDVCNAFAQRFNLTWREQAQVYKVSETAHAALLASNPSFTFTIGQSGGDKRSQTIDIVIPYAAFDLNLTFPIVANSTRYFPLKQAQNSSQYTLGRAFLQEAYIVADYDRRNFSVSQATFPPTSEKQQLIAIRAPSAEQTTPTGKNSLSAGAIAGIVIGVVVAVCLVLVIAIWMIRKRRRHAASELSARPKMNSMHDSASLPVEKGGAQVSEVPGNEGSWEISDDTAKHELPETPQDPSELEHPTVYHELETPAASYRTEQETRN